MVEFFSRAMVEFIDTGLIGIMVVITAYYAWTTSRILKANEGVLREMRLQRELETRPYIVVYPSILEDDSFIYLKIANHGKSAGQNLKLSLNKDVFSLEKKIGHYRNLQFSVRK